MWLLKVGKYEHLESLRQGNVHFNPLSFFREDGTKFRGDSMEGTYILDVSRGFYIDGINLGKLGGHGTLTHADSDNALIFCAAILDKESSWILPNNIIKLHDSFLSEMKKFGQHAIVFELEGFLQSLQVALSDITCNLAYAKVTYCNKENYVAVRTYISSVKKQLGETAIYFLKDETYKRQNEWRFIIDYINQEKTPVPLNENGSLDLKIPLFPVTNIIDLNSGKAIPR